MFSLFFVSRNVLISLISSVTFSLFRNFLFNLHVFVFFTVVVFFLWSILSLIVLRSDKMLEIISISLNLLRFDLWPKIWKMFHVHLRRNCILLHLDGMCWRYQLGLFALTLTFRLMFPYYFSILLICPLV